MFGCRSSLNISVYINDYKGKLINNGTLLETRRICLHYHSWRSKIGDCHVENMDEKNVYMLFTDLRVQGRARSKVFKDPQAYLWYHSLGRVKNALP